MLSLINFIEGDNERKLDGVTDEMIIKIGEGDNNAFEDFYRLTDTSVYGYALSLIKSRHEAKDIMQETYIKVRLNADRYTASGKPMAWVFTIAKNIAFGKLRSSKKEDISEDVDLMGASDTTEDNSVDRMVLQAALNILDEDSRQIVVLHCVSGLKHREIADSLGMKQSTVLSKYSRALKKLQEHLKER